MGRTVLEQTLVVAVGGSFPRVKQLVGGDIGQHDEVVHGVVGQVHVAIIVGAFYVHDTKRTSGPISSPRAMV